MSAPVTPTAQLQTVIVYRKHSEMTWQDLVAFIASWMPLLSILALILGWHSYEETKKTRALLGYKVLMHPVGMTGLIFGAIFTALWVLIFFPAIFVAL